MGNPKEKWSAHKFTKNVYDIWVPTHFKRICSVIDKLLPNLDFKFSHNPSYSFPSRLSYALQFSNLRQQIVMSLTLSHNKLSTLPWYSALITEKLNMAPVGIYLVNDKLGIGKLQ